MGIRSTLTDLCSVFRISSEQVSLRESGCLKEEEDPPAGRRLNLRWWKLFIILLSSSLFFNLVH